MENLGTKNSLSQRLIVNFATLGPIGNLPTAPGTWGSAFAVLIWWFGFSHLNSLLILLIILMLFPIAVLSSNYAEKQLGKDARSIVIDEVIGQWITLSFCPFYYLNAIFAFFLFRIFDITKPTPVRNLEKLPGGWGVVMDDVAAGVYGMIAMILLNKYLL
ncbi:phosphatidylglycerophosphatase A [bacterium]|nr:phosphatidylglycerophosphatase A [bacterium]